LEKAEQYRRYAAEFLALPAHLGDPRSRGVLSQIATAWVSLAEQAEKNVKMDLVCEAATQR